MRKLRIDPSTKSVSLDIRDPVFYNNPYPFYEELQERCPMFFWREHQLWTFTQHADVSAILRDRRFGRQISQLRSPQELGQATVPEHLQPFFDIDRLSMIGLEPPAHTRLRSLVQKAFVGKQIEALRPRIEALCDHLIDQMVDCPLATMGFYETDLIASYATPIPVIVIAEILGVPTDVAPKLLDWSHNMVQMYEMKRTAEMELAAVQASKEFVAYMRSLVMERRQRRGSDLISELIEVESSGERLTEDELIANCILLLNAGHEATVNVIGNGLLALLHHPDQIRLWRNVANCDAAQFEKIAVEELLRYDTPLHQFNRWVLEPMTMHGQNLEVGQEVALLLGAANRDPLAFASPHRLQLTRSHNPHLSLGGGIHYCLGASLARLEVQVAVPRLLKRLSDFELADEPEYRNNFHFHGLRSLNVRYR